MEIIFYVALWLLSGFLAAWVGHTFCDGGETDTSNRAVFWFTVIGPIGLILSLFHLVFFSESFNKPFFKAKEPK